MRTYCIRICALSDDGAKIIAAPAGFGKTTLVSQWLADCGRPTAWLSLDEGDSDLARFLTYLVAALQTIAPTFGEGVLGVLQSPQPLPTVSQTVGNEDRHRCKLCL